MIYSICNFFRSNSEIRNPIIPDMMIFAVLLLVGLISLNTANGYVANSALFASLAQIEIFGILKSSLSNCLNEYWRLARSKINI